MENTQVDHTVEDSDAADDVSPLFDEEIVREDQLRGADPKDPAEEEAAGEEKAADPLRKKPPPSSKKLSPFSAKFE